eukprot:Clim_evm3s30 gene=Clim_evmTU3s30
MGSSKGMRVHFPRRIWVALTILMVLLVTWRQIWNFFFDVRRFPVTTPIVRSQRSGNGDLENEVGFAMIAMGSYARQLKHRSAVEALREIGGWEGPIYIITDALECFSDNSNEEFNLPPMHNVHIVTPDDGIDYGHSGSRMLAKAIKTKLFDLITDVDELVYMDTDILASIPDCVEPMIRKFREPGLDVEMLTETIGGPHSGIWYLRRTEKTEQCMTCWRENILSGDYRIDQDAMKNCMERELCGPFSGRITTEVMDFPPDDENIIHAQSMPMPACMMHYTRARCLRQGREFVQAMIDRYELQTYRNGEPYCESIANYPKVYSIVSFGESCEPMERAG